MDNLLIGLLSAVMATNQPTALSNMVQQKTGLTVTLPDKNDPIEAELQKIMADDDAAREETDEWIKTDQKFAEKGAGIGTVTLGERVKQRLDPVKAAYEAFLKRHPDHARGHLAYGSFLNEIGEEQAAQMEWEQGREMDPKNPAAWNNLANWYGHNGPVTKAFEYYGKAIELNPNESTYYWNLATTVYLFRRDGTNYYKIPESQIFDKALGLYQKALELDPENFALATDYAQTYYGVKRPKSGDPEADRQSEQKLANDALAAWQKALKLARDDAERQGVLIHFARIQIDAGRLNEARNNLNAVSNEMFTATKKLLIRKIERREGKEEKPKG